MAASALLEPGESCIDMIGIIACVVGLCLLCGVAASEEQYGYERALVEINGATGFIITPAEPAEGRPWAWYAPTFIGGYPNEANGWIFSRLLAAGWAICGVEVGESHGSPAGRAAYSAFYERVTLEYGLAAKACLVPQSRGGLMLYNWATENPTRVQCIAGIYPVCDLRSWPSLATAAPVYGMTEGELGEHLAEHNPIDRLAPLAEADVPIFHIHGDSDTVVPIEQNSQVVRDRYAALGGRMELVVVPGKGHAEIPEFFQNEALLQFLLRQGREPAGE